MAIFHNKLNTFKQALTFTLCACLLLLINACGFQLRGEYLLPEQLKTLKVTSVDKYGELTRILKQHLKINQVNLVSSTASSATTKPVPELRVLKDTLDRRTLSVFPNGQVAEYELIYKVRYQLLIDGQAPQDFEFELNRDYQDDPDFALAKSRELNLLLSEMRQIAADRILRAMASIQFN
ncbi:MAG: LPS assembly lipoprotein LptE [Thalassotalea sp.]